MLGKRWRGRRYRIFFSTDIHGSDRCFRKFLAAASVYEADALVLGGDIVGKGIVPIVEGPDGRFAVRFQGTDHSVEAQGLSAVQATINFNGFYPWVTDAPTIRDLESGGPERRARLFEELISKQINHWIDLVQERLPERLPCIITPGNDDPWFVDDLLMGAERIDCPEQRVAEIGPVLIASLGNTNSTPWHSDREYSEDELGLQIQKMLDDVRGAGPLVFNFHCPPYGSGLDTARKLDESFRPIVQHGTPVEIPVGSTAIRSAIIEYEPKVGLHGHIHEAAGATQIGATLCINPGSDYSAGVLKGAIVDLDKGGNVMAHLPTTG